MRNILYYIVFGLLYLISLIPFWLVYIISDGISFLLYYVIRYRRKIVLNNLRIAFPEKTGKELTKISRQFYRDFTDNFIEFIKMISISKKEVEKRFVCDYSPINNLYASGLNIQMILGHYFNWEYACLTYPINVLYPFVVVYKPISNKNIDRLFKYTRSRFGANMVSSLNYRKEFGPFAKSRYTIALVGDQNPADTNTAYWTDFFGKKVPVVKGPERGAKLNKTAVVMLRIYKAKRGFYKAEMELLTADPRSLPDGEITKLMLAFIEDAIRKQPSNYLWSHRRWKWEYVSEKHASLVI